MPDRVLSSNAEEETLRARLHEDPNDQAAFIRLAEIVRKNAAEGHEETDPQREADDAVWALAEELARSHFAWFPLIELARLSIEDDREVALRRLSTAAERDPSGAALGRGVAMLRDAGQPNDALGLGVGHWRPADHDLEVGRQLVLAALDARRLGDARRHLEVLRPLAKDKKDRATVADLEKALAEAERNSPPPTPAYGLPVPPVAPAPSQSTPAPAVEPDKEGVTDKLRKIFKRD